MRFGIYRAQGSQKAPPEQGETGSNIYPVSPASWGPPGALLGPSRGSLEALLGLQNGPKRAPIMPQDVPKSVKKRRREWEETEESGGEEEAGG